MEPICTIEDGGALELERKYGQYAQDSWEDRNLSLKKMDMIKSNLQDGPIRWGLLDLMAKELSILAISKDELNQANVEPFKIEL